MPKYISPLGTSCTADEAKTGGRLRFGYQEILSDGDRINFDITMCDTGAPRSSTFLTDSKNFADQSSPRDLYIDRLTGIPEGTTAQKRATSTAKNDGRYVIRASDERKAESVRDGARQAYIDRLTAPSCELNPARSER